MDLFSILIANYNNGIYFKDCFDSIIWQSYPHWEAIIVDDCSSDDSVDIIEGLIKNDNRFSLYKNEKNEGCGYTKRKCVALAKGKYCGFLDPDDIITQDAVEEMIKAHRQHPAASLINSDNLLCDENLKPVGLNPNVRKLKSGENLIDDIKISAFASFKKEAYDKTVGINEVYKKAVDHDLYLKLDEVGELDYVSKPLYKYRFNPNGISQNCNGIKANQWSILAKIEAHDRRKLIPGIYNISGKEADRLKKTWYTRELYFLRKDGEKEKLQRLLRRALTDYPSLLFKRSYIAHLVREFLK